ncbi:hypothetical protein [Roseibium sp.]|uniref:hypothetical protein n=1 Tax=Roseibium sp. TaxID=1936156 RepID=UPI003A983A1C
MNAQDELKQLFSEIDVRTDRALAGIRQVRGGAKVRRLRPSLLLSACQIGFISSLLFMVAELLRRGA